MDVVLVDGDVSYPATSGKRLRTLNLLLRLARSHRITYIARCHHGAQEARPAREFLRDHGVEPILVEDPAPRKGGESFYARLTCNLLSPLPYCVASHQSEQLRQALENHTGRRRVDLWQFEWTAHVGLLRRPRAPRVLVSHNVDTLIWQRYLETEANPLKRWYIHGQWRKWEAFERRAFAAVERIVAVSPEDADLIRTRFGVQRVDVVENGIDSASYAEVRPEPQPNTVLFLGSLEWRPNLDAVRLLLDTVFPTLRALQPAARLLIVGRNAPSWLARRAEALAGVELHSNVPDVRSYLARSTVMTVPLRIGGGSRLKILEALACGLPVVSTRIGAEGLALRDGSHLTLADGPQEMASALADCLRQPEKFRLLAAAGQRLVRQHYDWDTLAGKHEAVWEKCITVGQREVECASPS
jgi:glycosyltransferase involved in cell wall biosynthesis